MCVKKKKATTSPIARNFFSNWSITNLCYQPAFCQAERHFHPCALAMLLHRGGEGGEGREMNRDRRGKGNERITASELFFFPQLIMSVINSWGRKVFLGQLLNAVPQRKCPYWSPTAAIANHWPKTSTESLMLPHTSSFRISLSLFYNI